jgi:2-oxoisovalerate dehydrogenase E1 component
MHAHLTSTGRLPIAESSGVPEHESSAGQLEGEVLGTSDDAKHRFVSSQYPGRSVSGIGRSARTDWCTPAFDSQGAARIESVDEHFVLCLQKWATEGAPVAARVIDGVDAGLLLDYFDAQLQSRHLDFTLRWLQGRGEAFYTIGSAGHESNAAVALALRPTDPALLHYRSGGFYAARAAQVPGSTAIEDVLNGGMAASADRISGGRHKVFGNADLNVIPQTSTIGSHLPRAFGLAFGLGLTPARTSRVPEDAVVVCSFGDASANHSTSVGALNAAAYCAHRGVPLPLLLLCEDNGIGISTRSPDGWVARSLSALPAVEYAVADGTDPVGLLAIARELVGMVRSERRPAVLHLKTVRFMGHAGSDVELAYRSRREILADYALDPLLATASVLIRVGALSAIEVLDRYERMRREVMAKARGAGTVDRLDSVERVMAPIHANRPDEVGAAAAKAATDREVVFAGRLPEAGTGFTLAQSVNAALRDVMAAWPQTLVFGEDVARKGGVYGVTRGLRKTFGAQRVFDTLLDEQTILGTALGTALLGSLPIPEIQYLAYLHNAEDQLRGEAASLRFFSDGQYQNGMVVRVAGLAYQKGFGGHFHNDNSIAVLRDIPGLVLAIPSQASSAPGLLRQCIALAEAEGRVCVFLEPIALYHQRDLHAEGDRGWLAPYAPPSQWASQPQPLGSTRLIGSGADILVVTFGNGVLMSLRAMRTLAERSVHGSVMDLQWLAPLPVEELLREARGFPCVLVVDETRASGGVSEAVVAALVDGGYGGRIGRVNSADSFIPLGPAADLILLKEADIVRAANDLAGSLRVATPSS